MENLNLVFSFSNDFEFNATSNNKYFGKLVVKNQKFEFIDAKGVSHKFNDDINKLNEYIKKNNLIFNAKDPNSRWIEYNPNPQKNNTGDCSIRAITKALNIKYEDAFALSQKYSKEMYLMPEEARVINKLLKKEFNVSRRKNSTKETVNDFALSHPNGTYILHVHGHMVACVNGYYYDSWDSGKKKVLGIYDVKDGEN